MSTFKWTGGAGPNWSSAKTVGTTYVTNWLNTSDGTTTGFPGGGDSAVFNNGGAISVGGGGDAAEFLIQSNTTVILTDSAFNVGSASAVFDLAVDDGSTLIIESGARMQNDGSVSVVGLGAGLGGTSGTATMEVDPGGLFTTDALIIGDSTDDAGVVTLDGALEFVVAAGGSVGNGELTVGNQGTGSLDISNTPLVFTQSVALGVNQGAAGSMSLDSSTWDGGDVDLGAAGTGHMTIGSGANVALVDMIVGSAQTGSGDLLVTGANSFMVDLLTIGASGTGTATFGAGSTGTFATVTVGESVGAIANLTLDGSTWNTGILTIGQDADGHATAGAGEIITVNDAVLGSSKDVTGDLTLDGAVLNGGTVVIGQDGTGDLAIGSGSSGSVTAAVVGEDAGSSGTLTIDDATWSAGSLTVGQTGTGQAAVGTGATGTFDNVLIGPNGEFDVTEAAGSAGTVVAQQVTIAFGTLDVSAGGEVLIGAGSGSNGAVAIGNKSLLTGLGLLKGDVVLSSGGLVQAKGGIPGALKVDGNITGAGTIEPLMTLEVKGGIGAGVDIAFSGSVGAQVGDLVLGLPAGNLGTITGFGVGNTIDIQGSVYSTAVFMQGTSASAGTLTLSGGLSPPLSMLVEGTYAPNNFLATPGASDTIVTLIPCFAAGTRIAAERGMVAVEALREGDRVRTLLGHKSDAVAWLGHRHVDCSRHPDPKQVWPICVRAGAFGPARPFRDLFLSPDHALYFDGALIPVRYLVNGRTIFQVERDEVAYWHVELADHNVLYAEGVPAESYLDTGNRGGFVNGGPMVDLHPDFSRQVWEARGCAPLLVAGPAVAAAKRRLLVRAAAQGHATTDDAGLDVWVNGRKLRARIDGRVWRVRLPVVARVVRLVSRVWHPAHVQPDADDQRALGVAIARLWLDRNEVQLDSAILSLGWHALEREWRWTNGDAALVVGGARDLAFEVTMTGNYWQEDKRIAANVA